MFRYRFSNRILPARHFRDNFIVCLRETTRWPNLNVAFILSLQWSTAWWANGVRGLLAITDAEVALKGAAGWSRSRKRMAESTVRTWTRRGHAAASKNVTLEFARSHMLKVSIDRYLKETYVAFYFRNTRFNKKIKRIFSITRQRSVLATCDLQHYNRYNLPSN